MRSEAPTLSLTVLVATCQEPKGCTYFACTSPDFHQKKTSIILDCNSTIHNSHTQAKFINSCVFRRKDVHLKAVIHSSLFFHWKLRLTNYQPQHSTHKGIPNIGEWQPWAFLSYSKLCCQNSARWKPAPDSIWHPPASAPGTHQYTSAQGGLHELTASKG